MTELTDQQRALKALDILVRRQPSLSDDEWREVRLAKDHILNSKTVPEKITRYPGGYVPPEDGEAGTYYVEGWNDCVDEMIREETDE